MKDPGMGGKDVEGGRRTVKRKEKIIRWVCSAVSPIGFYSKRHNLVGLAGTFTIMCL